MPGPGAGLSPQPTDLYGDWASGEAAIYEAGKAPWTTDVGVGGAVASQLLTNRREATLEPTGEVVCLHRRCLEYRFEIEGREEGIEFRSEVRWLVLGRL